MRTASLLVLLSLLASSISWADGCYIPKADKRTLRLTYGQDITEPSQKAVIAHFGGKERLILEVSYKGRVSEFAWLIPTPSKPKVKKFDLPIFHELHTATAPRTVHWIDSKNDLFNPFLGRARGGSTNKPDVRVIEQKQIGIYDVAVLKAGNAEDLIGWLKANKYQVSSKLTRVIADYIKRGWIFTAARINVNLDKEGAVKLREGRIQSLQLDFASPKPVYPLKISSVNKGRTKLLIYVISEHRVETPILKTTCAANYKSGNFWMAVDEAARLAFDIDVLPRHPYFVTKLTGNISSNRMTKDLIFTPAKTNEPLPMPTVQASFLDNIGATILFVLLLSLMWPINLVTCFFFLALTIRSKNQQRKALWSVLAVIIFFCGVPVAIMMGAPITGDYSIIGIAAIALAVYFLLKILARRWYSRRLPKS